MNRYLRAIRNPQRLAEIAECRRWTGNWARLLAAYVGVTRMSPFDISLAGGTFHFEERSDVPTFWQIFCRHVYPVSPDDSLIVDAGANIGAFSLYALLAAPRANVVAVEPSPACCDRLRRLIREHGLEERWTLVNAALGPKRGTTTIEGGRQSQFVRTGYGGQSVNMLPLEDVLPAGRTVDLLKMDIEGAEYGTLFAASDDTLCKVRRMVLEFHPQDLNDPNARPLTALVDRLTRTGFNASVQQHGDGYGMVYLSR